ncbi:amino acid transporter, partial [Aureobasidium melanogenum]
MDYNGMTFVAEICALVKEGSVLSAAETESGIAKNKHTQWDEKCMHPEHDLLSSTAPAILPVIIDPEPSGESNGKRGKANAAGKRQQVLEDGNCFREDERDYCETESARQPGDPVDYGVGLQVLRVAKDTDEDVFCGNVKVETSADDQTGQSDTVADHLDGLTRTLASYPLAAPAVNDKTEAEVGSSDDAHTDEKSLAVVSWVLHLRDDRKHSTGTSTRHEDRTRSNHARRKARVGYGIEAKLIGASLRSSCRTVAGGDCNDKDKDCNEDGGKSNPHSASTMMGQGVDTNGHAHDTRASKDNVGDDEQSARQLFHDFSSDDFRHIGNTVLRACQPMTLSEPPTAPSEYIAAGIDRTPRAKMVLRKMTVAIGHPTFVRFSWL